MIKAILNPILDRIKILKAPNDFARSIGVRVGEGVRFYGVSRGMFGSEPWMIKIGDRTHITAGVQFVTHDGGTLILRQEVHDLEWSAPIEVGNDVYIGIRSIILPGVSIGDRSIVGAGSVVTKSVPSNSVVAGVPARHICSTDDYLERMRAKSLGFGHLRGEEKDQKLRQHYAQLGWFS